MRLEVACFVTVGRTPYSVHPVEPKLFFEDGRKRLIRVDDFVGVMDLERLRMNLVHGNVKMLVFLLAVANRDVLVFL
jgi:hypothetical protein